MVDGLQQSLPPAVAAAMPRGVYQLQSAKSRASSRADNQRFRDMLAQQLLSAPAPHRAAYHSAAELSEELAGIEPAELRRIDSAARQLEGLLLETMLKQMWATLPKSSLLGNGLEAKFYREMWLEELAADIASNGPGTGVAATLTWEMIEQHLAQDSLTADRGQPAESVLPTTKQLV